MYPYVVLERDNWDDYGFKTLFHATVYASPVQTVNLRGVKLLKLGQADWTEIALEFEELDDTYCSLGQELAYYESLMELTEDIRLEYLSALRDAAASLAIREQFEYETGFRHSLLRTGPAARALDDAPSVLWGMISENSKLSFTFFTKFGENEFPAQFRFCQVEGLPGRINAIIGYNGTGKTQLLSNLAWVARADLNSRRNDGQILRYGHLDPPDIRFGGVVAVSYSAFDTFELPRSSSDARNGDDSRFGYTYCGLRKQHFQGSPDELKNPQDILSDVEAAIDRVDTDRRRGYLNDALRPLREEPSFKLGDYELDFRAGDNDWREEFKLMSSGHKISVNIVVQLVAALQQRSLVLIDEPEAHLHPPLLAALMKGIGIALEVHQSYAVIATHSPVVLQEIAGRYAHVLRREGSSNAVEEPDIETFGENLGLLTRHVFNLDNSQSDYVGTLQKLAADNSVEHIESLLGGGLSSQARNIVKQARRG